MQEDTQLEEAKEFLKEKRFQQPETGIILGTGLNALLDYVDIRQTIPYTEIPGFCASEADFHKGNLIYGSIGEKSVLIMQGRFHFYDGYSMQQIAFPVRMMKSLGLKRLLLSNAAGGINLNFRKGELVLIKDHINLQSGNPLIGKNIDLIGPRFPDMSTPYSKDLNALLRKKASEYNIGLKEGVYAAVNGPSLETKAEYRILKIIGADMVGMSTVPEVIAANHANLPCAAVSVITDECDPDNLKPVNIAEIIEVAGKADKKLSKLFIEVIKSL